MENKIKISFGLIVVNGEPFIKYNLENLYPHAHEILIVEGAVEKYKHAATSDGHSLDNTVRIIKEFPDPENKIRLIQREGFWPEKDEMSNAYMVCCKGDYVWQIDVDEFYEPKDIEKVRKFLEENPDVTRIDIQTINFWHGFNAVIQGASYCFGADRFRRIFKFRQGYRYLTHRPPTVIDRDGKICSDDNVVTADELTGKLNIYMFHYAYVFQEYVERKAEYYSSMNWGQGHEDGKLWFKDEWQKLSNPLRVHIINYPPSWLIPFTGKHPEVIQKMTREIEFNENSAVLDYLKQEYKKYQRVGENLIKVILAYSSGSISRKHAVMRIISNLQFPYNYRDLKANRSILMAARNIIRSR